MSTKISWAQDVWNCTVGCSQVSEGCAACYAMGQAHRGLSPAHRGLTVMTDHGVDWNGTVRCLPERLDVPLRKTKPTRWFVDSMSDLWHPEVPQEFIAEVFAVMALATRHQFLVLTKRPQRMRKVLSNDAFADECDTARLRRNPLSMVPDFPPPGFWPGVSIESDRYCWRADHLRVTPSRGPRFISAEPLLGPLPSLDLSGISWLICGGESGPKARPMRAEWAADLRDRCADAGVAFWMKQAGAVLAREWGMKGAGHEVERMPPEFQVQEYPT